VPKCRYAPLLSAMIMVWMGEWGNAKSIKRVVCLSHIIYWSRSFCLLAHVPGWDELSFINLDTGKAYIEDPK
jgi:hypothetical protein